MHILGARSQNQGIPRTLKECGSNCGAKCATGGSFYFKNVNRRYVEICLSFTTDKTFIFGIYWRNWTSEESFFHLFEYIKLLQISILFILAIWSFTFFSRCWRLDRLRTHLHFGWRKSQSQVMLLVSLLCEVSTVRQFCEKFFDTNCITTILFVLRIHRRNVITLFCHETSFK